MKTRSRMQSKPAEILIFGDIGDEGQDANAIMAALKAVPKDAPETVVRIHSDGGDVFQGIVIYNLLRSHHTPIRTVNEGYAASAASYIFMAGDVREMKPASQLMIHEPEVGFMGRAEEVHTVANAIAKTRDDVSKVYAERSGLSVAEVRKMMAAETYLTPEEAVERGFATTVSKDPPNKNLKVAMLRRKAKKMAMKSRRMEDVPVDETAVADLDQAATEAAAEAETPAEGSEEMITIPLAEYQALIELRDAAEVVAEDAGTDVADEAAMEDDDNEEKKPEATAKGKMRSTRLMKADRKAIAKAERARSSGIFAACKMAGISDVTALKLIDQGASLAAVQKLCMRKMQQRNPAVSKAARTSQVQHKKPADPDEGFRKEYRDAQMSGVRMTSSEFEYINSRRMSSGLLPHAKAK